MRDQLIYTSKEHDDVIRAAMAVERDRWKLAVAAAIAAEREACARIADDYRDQHLGDTHPDGLGALATATSIAYVIRARSTPTRRTTALIPIA